MSLFSTLIPAIARPLATNTDAATSELGPTVKPAYEIKEAADAFAVTVFLPGVAKDGVELTAGDGEFRLVGRRAWQQPAGWTSLHRETSPVPFELVLTHDNLIATDKIAAELNDGVLRVSLPKHEAVKPRKIAVN